MWKYQAMYDPQKPDPNGVSGLGYGEDFVWQQTSHLDGFKEATIAYWQHCLTLARGFTLFELCPELNSCL